MFEVNCNGASAKDLLEQNAAVAEAAKVLQDALRDAMPHSRDYQTIENGMLVYDADMVYYKNLARHVDEVHQWAITRGAVAADAL